jgi:hypothetical protein
MRLYVKLISLATIIMFSCNNEPVGQKEGTLAEYKGRFLYKSDIPEDIWKKFSQGGDSSGLLKSFIDKWLENQVLVQAASEKLTEQEKNKEKLMENYRNSLLIYEYHQKLVREKMDTGVTDEEIRAFYESHLSTFQLRKNIVKIRYVKINKGKADISGLRKLMQNPSPANDSMLKVYAEKEADNFYMDSNWLYLDDITKEIPLDENYNQQRFLSNNKFISIEENSMLYLLYIIDFRIRNATSPIEFEKDKIKDIIKHQRKLDFLKNNQRSLVSKAIESGEIKYYIKNR